MDSSKKEKLLKKYLDKKRNQRKRDLLVEELSNLTDASNKTRDINLYRRKGRKKKNKKKVDVIVSDDEFDLDKFRKNKDEETKIEELVESDTSDDAKYNNIVEYDHKQILIDESVVDECSPITLDRNIIDENITDEYSPITFTKRIPLVQEKRQKLFIFDQEFEIIETIKNNDVVFIHGDTGTGKTTQIPQFLLEAGLSKGKRIGVTQPRRISTISISSRINHEINEKISGYKIKYENNIKANSMIKVMTEGILVKEIQNDFTLSEYSVIILDEVHERTTNMDLLIGLLSKIIKYRKNEGTPLKLILMSATIDPKQFCSVFSNFKQIFLRKNSNKVDVYYENETSSNYLQSTFSKIMSLLDTKKSKNIKRGIVINDENASILVFLPTKKDIYTLKTMLEKSNKVIKVLPLHSGLSKNQQNLVYTNFKERKIVLSTNIAETSITIDDIKFVIDTGREKIRISNENTSMFKIGFISKSSAIQRAGRAGRTGPGVCFRIFSNNTFGSLREASIPQILLEPLDDMILQLKTLGIENVEDFPFLNPPSSKSFLCAYKSLSSLGCLIDGKVSDLGRYLSRYPVPPRCARLLSYEGTDDIFYHLICIVAILSSNLEIRKGDFEGFFRNKNSDLIAYLEIFYSFLKNEKNSNFKKMENVFKELCKLKEYLLKLSDKENIECRDSITDEEEEKIRKLVFFTYSNQLAVRHGDNYLFKSGEVSLSKDSIEYDGKYVIFDHLICSSNQTYAKCVTAIETSWF